MKRPTSNDRRPPLPKSRRYSTLFCGEYGTRAPNRIRSGMCFYELEAVAERCALAGHRECFDRPAGESKLQPKHFTQRDFFFQHGRDPALADVYGRPAHHRAVALIDLNIHFQFEARASPPILSIGSSADSSLAANVQEGIRLQPFTIAIGTMWPEL